MGLNDLLQKVNIKSRGSTINFKNILEDYEAYYSKFLIESDYNSGYAKKSTKDLLTLADAYSKSIVMLNLDEGKYDIRTSTSMDNAVERGMKDYTPLMVSNECPQCYTKDSLRYNGAIIVDSGPDDALDNIFYQCESCGQTSKLKEVVEYVTNKK